MPFWLQTDNILHCMPVLSKLNIIVSTYHFKICFMKPKFTHKLQKKVKRGKEENGKRERERDTQREIEREIEREREREIRNEEKKEVGE